MRGQRQVQRIVGFRVATREIVGGIDVRDRIALQKGIELVGGQGERAGGLGAVSGLADVGCPDRDPHQAGRFQCIQRRRGPREPTLGQPCVTAGRALAALGAEAAQQICPVVGGVLSPGVVGQIQPGAVEVKEQAVVGQCCRVDGARPGLGLLVGHLRARVVGSSVDSAIAGVGVLEGVGHLVGDEAQAGGRARLVGAGREGDVGPDGERAGIEVTGGARGVVAGVDADMAAVNAGRVDR